MRLVSRRGTAAVRATRLLLDTRGGCWRILHAFKNNIEIMLRRRYSSHLCDLLVGRPTHGFSAARQHQLQDPHWRRGAVEHTLSYIGRHLDADGVVGWEGTWRGEDVLRQVRALSNGSRRWCRRRGGGDVCCCTKRSSITCSFLLFVFRLLLVSLAPTDQGGPGETDEEKPKDEEQEAVGDAGALGTAADIAATTTPAPSAGAVRECSSLAEDILAERSTLPANDPVRVETAAYLRKCMLDGTTPPLTHACTRSTIGIYDPVFHRRLCTYSVYGRARRVRTLRVHPSTAACVRGRYRLPLINLRERNYFFPTSLDAYIGHCETCTKPNSKSLASKK